MALKVAEVLIKWRQQGGNEVQAETKKMGEALAGLGSKAKAAGAVLSAGLTAPLLLIGKQAIDAASDLNESMSAVNTVFGSTSDQVTNFARTAATQLGQSRQSALSAAAAMGALFKGVGLTEQQMADFSTSLLSASADLGSFYNMDPGAVLDKLRSGLVGEVDGLRQFGILLNAADVEAKALAMGLADANGEISEGAKVQARYALIMEQLGAAQGDFGRTSDGLANSQRILAARLEDVRGEIGQQLLPWALKAAQAFSGLLDWFSGLSEQAKTMAVVLGTVAAAAGPVLLIAGQLMTALAGLAPVLTVLTGPIGLVVAAVVGLGIAFKENWFGIRDLVTGIVDRIGDTLGRMIQFFTRAKERGLNPFRLAMRTLIVTLGEKLGPGHPLVEFLQSVLRLGERLKKAYDKEGFSGVIAEMVASYQVINWDQVKETLTTQGSALIGSLLHGMQDFWNNTLSPWVHAVLDGIPGLLETAGTWLTTSGSDIVNGLLTGMQDYWNNTLSPWLHGVLDGIPGLLDTAGTWLSGPGTAIITGLLTGMQDFWNNHLSGWLHAVIDGIPTLFSAAGTWLTTGGAAIITGLLNGMQDFWNNHLSGWLHAVIDGIPGLFSAAATWLVAGGTAIITGLLTGMQDFWNNHLSGWLHTVVDGLPGLFTDAYTWLQEAGGKIIDGLRHGIVDFWNNELSPWMGGMKDTFQGKFAEAGTWLVDAGKAIIQGLIDGIGAQKDAILNAIMAQIPSEIDVLGVKVPTGVSKPQDAPAKDEQRAYGGPMGKRYTLVGEYGPELLIGGRMVMPHGAAQSRIEAMGGMAYGGTGDWSAWLAAQDAKTKQAVRSLRQQGMLNADVRAQLVRGLNVPAFNMAMGGGRYGYDKESRRPEREARGDSVQAITRRAERNHARNSDALNRASAYGDRTSDYSRLDRVLAREARNGSIYDNGLSNAEKQYLINNYGTIHVQAKDSNVAREIADQMSSRDR